MQIFDSWKFWDLKKKLRFGFLPKLNRRRTRAVALGIIIVRNGIPGELHIQLPQLQQLSIKRRTVFFTSRNSVYLTRVLQSILQISQLSSKPNSQIFNPIHELSLHMANFLTGSCIEVLPTDNTNSRFPDQIGCLGIVEHAPIHPSTWFTIKMTDGRSIKLQTTAMKHVAKNDSRHQIMQNTMPVQAHKSSHLICATPMGKSPAPNPSRPYQRHAFAFAFTPKFQLISMFLRHYTSNTPPLHLADVQKENHRARSNSNVGIAHFTKGVSVIILRTDNVLHRVPHLVGVVGIIKEVPVHPITWFKIEFPSGQVATFRPSAFKLNDGKDEEVQRPSKKPTAFSANYNQLYSKKNLSSKIDKSNEHEYAAGMQVVIRSGELSGERGEVLKSSNGWIQVITPLGKVAKRAHELDFADCSQSSEDRDYYPPSHFNLKQDDHQRSNEIVSPSGQRALFLSHHKSGMGPRNLLNRLSQKSNTSFTPEGQKRNHVDMSISGKFHEISPLFLRFIFIPLRFRVIYYFSVFSMYFIFFIS